MAQSYMAHGKHLPFIEQTRADFYMFTRTNELTTGIPASPP